MSDPNRTLIGLTLSLMVTTPILFLAAFAWVFGANLLELFVPQSGTINFEGEQSAAGILVLLVQVLVAVFVEMLIGVAVIHTMLVDHSRKSWAAISATPGGRKWAYFFLSILFGAVLVVVALVALYFALVAGVVGGSEDEIAIASTVAICGVNLIMAIFFGLIFPAVVVDGRVRLGMAIFQGFRRFGPLLIFLFLPTVVISGTELWLAELAVRQGWAWQIVFTPNFVRPEVVALSVLQAVLLVVMFYMTAVALAKVYARVPPLSGRTDTEMPEVFE